MEKSLTLKKSGNDSFKSKDYQKAIGFYTSALQAAPSDEVDHRVVLLSNRAACHLKLKAYDACCADCTDALVLNNEAAKALFRRGQAHEFAERYQDAFGDYRRLLAVDPNNKEAALALRKLRETLKKDADASGIGTESVKIGEVDISKATEDDIKLAEKFAGYSGDALQASELFRKGALEPFAEHVKTLAAWPADSRNGAPVPAFMAAVLHTIANIAGAHKEACEKTFELIGGATSLGRIASFNLAVTADDDKEHKLEIGVRAVVLIWEKLDFFGIVPRASVFEELMKIARAHHRSHETRAAAMLGLNKLVADKGENGEKEAITVAALVEKEIFKNAFDLIVEFQSKKREDDEEKQTVIGPTKGLLAFVFSLLDSIYVDENSKVNKKEKDRENLPIILQLKSLTVEQLVKEDTESRIYGAQRLTCLFEASQPHAKLFMAEPGVWDALIAMGKLDSDLANETAVTLLHWASTDSDACKRIAFECLPLLGQALELSPPIIAAKAAVIMCKLAMSARKMYEEVLNECPDLLDQLLDLIANKITTTNPTRLAEHRESKKLAAEALSYYTKFNYVRTALTRTPKPRSALFELAKDEDPITRYWISCVMMNVCMTRELQERKMRSKMTEQHLEQLEMINTMKENISEEQKEKMTQMLGVDFSGEQVDITPEEENERVVAFCKSGCVRALVALSRGRNAPQTESGLSAIAQSLNNIAEIQELRGYIVKEGGVPLLLRLTGSESASFAAEEDPYSTPIQAAHALCKIAITMDPSHMFPEGTGAITLVRPCLRVCRSGYPLQQFESLMALTNVTSKDTAARDKVYFDGGISYIENVLWEDDTRLRRAATEAMCNLIMCDQGVELFIGNKQQRVKLWTLLSQEDDVATASAAAGALAMLSDITPIAVDIIRHNGIEIYTAILKTGQPPMQHRAAVILGNLAAAEPIAEDMESKPKETQDQVRPANGEEPRPLCAVGTPKETATAILAALGGQAGLASLAQTPGLPPPVQACLMELYGNLNTALAKKEK